jgi:hypothetical protein
MALCEIPHCLHVGGVRAEFMCELLGCEIGMAARLRDSLAVFVQAAGVLGTEINGYLDLGVSGARSDQSGVGGNPAFRAWQWETV